MVTRELEFLRKQLRCASCAYCLLDTEWIADWNSRFKIFTKKTSIGSVYFLLKELATLYPGLGTRNVSGECLPGSVPRLEVSGYVPLRLVTRNVRVKALLDR